MKVLLMPFSGMALASWVALEASVVIAQTQAGPMIGPEMPISAIVVFQLGALVAAGVLLVKFGWLLRDWKRAIDQAIKLGTALEALAGRMDAAEAKAREHDKQHAQLQMLVDEHEVRLGAASRRTDRIPGRGA